MTLVIIIEHLESEYSKRSVKDWIINPKMIRLSEKTFGGKPSKELVIDGVRYDIPLICGMHGGELVNGEWQDNQLIDNIIEEIDKHIRA